MGFLDWLPWRRESRMLTLQQWTQQGLFAPSAAGVAVSEHTALTLPAYWSGVNLIAGAVAKLPRKVYRKTAAGREEVPDHAVAWLIQTEPSEYAIPMVFWRTLMAHVLTWGNGYAEIERDKATRPVGLLTITPDKISPVVENGVLFYLYNGSTRIPARDILHIPGLGFDGIKGYSVVQMARQTLGLGLAAERYGTSFFANGAMPGVVLEHPGKLSDPAQARLRASWNEMHQGPDRAHKLAITEEGMTAKVLSIPAKDSQLIETRELSVLDVARVLNLNPSFLGKSGERPGGNYEAGRLDFLDNTLDPWLIAIEQECNRKLLSGAQRGTYFVEHVRNAVLRTDAKSRAEVQKLYVDMGVMSPEYVARLENLPKPEPKEMPAPPPPPQPPGAVAPDPEDDPAEPEPPDPAARQRLRALLVSTVGRSIRNEADKARSASKRGAAAFGEWIDTYYAHRAETLAEMLQPALALSLALAGRAGDGLAEARAMAAEHVERSKRDLLALRASNLEEQADILLKRWEVLRPEELADAALNVEESHAA